MNPAVSVIIPVYNAAPYLNDCITSIVAQTFTNWELFLIDDGSTDDSATICQKWENRDARIHYLYKTNGGVSSARNMGIDHAKGSRIMFVDADDICHYQILEGLLEPIIEEECDVVACRIDHFKDRMPVETKLHSDTCRTLYGISSIYNCFNDADILHAPFAKLYNKDIINKNNIRFIESLSLGEDLCFNLDYLEHCNKGLFIDAPLYYYRDTEGSLTKKIRGDYADIQMMLFDRKIEFLTRKSIRHNLQAQAPGVIRDILLSECRSQAKLKDKIASVDRLKKHQLMQLSKSNSSISNWLITYAIKLLPSPLIIRIFK